MPSWSELEQFLVSGLALGGVYALSGVGLVVLYRATGVLYLAFGAVGAGTVYLQVLDLSDLEHVRLLAAEVLPKLG